MDEFFEEMQRLRDAVDDQQIYETSSTDDWNTLTSSMDALEDTHHAISDFVAAASKLEPKFLERELGERYLRTYGVMQAFVIQRDAALNLHVSLGMPEPDLKPLDNIRDLRVAAAGHPTLQDRPRKLPRRAHFISQMTLGDDGMELLTVDGSGQPVFRNVPIPSLAIDQEKFILGLIRRALARLT
jgi:hypothetical protein